MLGTSTYDFAATGASGCLGFTQKSSPSQKLYECRISKSDKATAKAIQSRIFEFVEREVKSRKSSDTRKIATTHEVVIP